jgi:flagellar basal-body rod modification protein FlgD
MVSLVTLHADPIDVTGNHGTARRSDTANWIGRNALIAADFVSRCTMGDFAGQVLLDAPAQRVTIDLLDQSGLIVHTIIRHCAEAPIQFRWTGVTGSAPHAGKLRVRVSARDGLRQIPTITNVWTPISALQYPADGREQRLVTPNGLIAPDAVISLG